MVRFTKPSPDHPRDEGPKDMLKRHFALVKAILIAMFVMTVSWVTLTAAFFFGFDAFTAFEMNSGSFSGILMMGAAFYIARLITLYFLPVEY
ncbi:hypothetical protein DMJ13_22425 [halophilic archaeon]|nr:hypothetical protein DMJ13_22425 [halophilic archaeon]